jgi:hypothetical protein
MVDAWLHYLRNGEEPGRGNDNIKYTALNILPVFRQGSLEFRCGGAPDEPDKIVWWAKICNAIVRYAAENYFNPYELGYALSEQGPETILYRVLEHANLGPQTTERVFNELTADGNLIVDAYNDFRDVQVLVYSIPWDEYMSEINKVNVPNPFGNKKPKKIRDAAEINFADFQAPEVDNW